MLTGAVATIAIVGNHDTDPSFAFTQQHAGSLSAAALAGTVGSAPEPLPGNSGRPGVSAHCVSSGRRAPVARTWSCRVRYRSGDVITYAVKVESNGDFRGVNRDGSRTVFGHVKVPGVG